MRAGTRCLSAAGAVNSAAVLLLRSGVANRSGIVGRYFMNHNCTAMLAVDPRVANDSVYQKTLGINDFYLSRRQGRPAARQCPASWQGLRADPRRPIRVGRPGSPVLARPAQRRLYC